MPNSTGPSSSPNPLATDPVIDCEGLVKRYGSFTALAGIDLQVPAGVVGLLGPNGAGKSTFIGVLLGQTPITGGTAHVLGCDVRHQQRRIRMRVGYMPEYDCLIPGFSGTGMVHYAARLSGMSHADAMQRTHEVLDYVQLDEARYRPSEQYSTGMKQRLKLAQALVHDPDLLFLDEPTNGMDPAGREAMLNLITDLGKAGISVLVCSHLLPDVERVCEKVIILGRGNLVAEGCIDKMREPHPTLFSVTFEGGEEPFRRQLVSRRIAVNGSPEDGTLELELPAAGEERSVFVAAQEAGATVQKLVPRRSSLEELFMEAVRSEGTA